MPAIIPSDPDLADDAVCVADVITRQLTHHGYNLTPEEARDVAAQVVMVLADRFEQRIERSSAAPTFERDKYAKVWSVGGPDRARAFFGAPRDAVVVVLKHAPETERERAKFRPNAKLYGVKCESRTSGDSDGDRATAGARRG